MMPEDTSNALPAPAPAPVPAPDAHNAAPAAVTLDQPGPGAETQTPATERGTVPPAGTSEIARGAYTIWVADKDGNLIDPPTDPRHRDREPNPADPNALDIYYVLEDSPQPPPAEQVELQLDIDKVLRAATRLYLGSEPIQMEKFRAYFVRLFRIAQLGMEGQNAVPTVARGVLTAVTAELIDDEAGRIKNGHLMKLGRYVIAYSVACFALYSVIYLSPTGWFVQRLKLMQVDPPLLASFAILWIGCFVGVWLSYGIRKSTFTLVDLTRTEEDRLAPHLRLVFAGLLAMILGLLFALDFVEVRIGDVSFTAIHSSPMLALLVGLFCGISELALPASIGTRAQSFISSLN
jgi:hypothetical protein